MTIKLVAHRGLAQYFPENSMEGFVGAIAAGADAIECDVQFNRQGRAFVLHDDNLQRVAGIKQDVAELSVSSASKISIHEPGRFGDKYKPCRLPQLAELVALVRQHPELQFFVEIKAESFAWISRQQVLTELLKILKGLEKQAIVISFDYEFLNGVREASDFRLGWVLETLSERSLKAAELLQAEYLICDYKMLSDTRVWKGGWQWFVYDVVSAKLALELYAQGVEWMESWDVASLGKALGDATSL